MKDRTSKTNLLENGKNYPMKIQEAIIRMEKIYTVSASDSRTTSFKTIDLGSVFGSYSDFSDKVFEIISNRYWQELADDISTGDKQIDYDYFTGDDYEYEEDLQADEATLTAKVRNIGINGDFDILLEVKVKLPDTNILIPKY